MASRNATINATGRTRDDSKILNREVLQYSSVRLPLAVAVGLVPIIVSSMLYVSTFTIKSQFFIGCFAGLLGMFAFQLFEVHRSAARRHKSLQISQLAELSQDDVKRLVTEKPTFPDWVKFTDFEKGPHSYYRRLQVAWLNKQMDIVWPFLNKAVCTTLKEQLQPILAEYAMGPIQKFGLDNLNLGDKAPLFDGIKVTEGEEDETVLETMFQWTPEYEDVVLNIEVLGPDYKAKVYDIHVSGTLKFVLKPLLEAIPCFGAVLVSFTKPPKIQFELNFGKVNFPSYVEKMVHDIIRSTMMDLLVSPNRVVVPVAPGDWSYLELHPIAELDVTLIEAQDIMKTDVIGKSDPFCEFYVRAKADKIKRSTTKKNKKSAVWNESFFVEVEDKELQTLTVRLMDDEAVDKSQHIGSAEYKLADMKPGVAEDVWLDMVEDPTSKADQGSRGRVHLLIIYKPLPDNDPRRKVKGGESNSGVSSSDRRNPDDPPISPHLGAEPRI